MASVKASDLIALFNQMADEKWKYVAGAHRQGEVDCSGAFYYAYAQLGGYMYHGSNTMWRKYTTEKGKIGEIDLVPGMAVFKVRIWTSNNSTNGWYETDPGDVYHVGLYVGNDTVVEAKGTKYGVVTSKLSTWHLAARLKDTVYDTAEDALPSDASDSDGASGFPFMGVVSVTSGYLNLRTGPSKSYPYWAKANDGDVLNVVAETGDWYVVEHAGRRLYASKAYVLRAASSADPSYVFTVRVSGAENKSALEALLSGYDYDVKAGDDAA